MLSKSTHHGNHWPRTWRWDSCHVDSIKDGMTALKVYILLSLSLPLNWFRECSGCPGVRRMSSQVRASDLSKVIQWISHVASTVLPHGSSSPKSFLQQKVQFASSGYYEGDQIWFQGHAYPLLLPRYMGPLLGSITALFFQEDFSCLEILASQLQCMKGRRVM